MNLILPLFRSVSRIAFLDPHDNAVTYQIKEHTFRSHLATDGFDKPGNRTVAFQFGNNIFFVDVRLFLFQVLAVV